MMRPRVDIDLAALCRNFHAMQAAAAGARVGAVVKCDAYGLGAAPIARALARAGCGDFFVAYPDEGVALRASLGGETEDARIYVFHGLAGASPQLFLDAALTPVLNDPQDAERWAASAGGAPAALHIDTGMNRLGATLDEAQRIASAPSPNIALVISHLANASARGDPFNEDQRARFAAVAALFPDAKKSLSSSGGALIAPAFGFDLVRPGICLYGGSPFDAETQVSEPVATLTAPVIARRALSPGDPVGYGGAFRAVRPTQIAVLAIGYGDGVPLSFSNAGLVAFGAARAPIIGRVSMDLTAIDVTAMASPPEIGERGELFGANLPLDEAASAGGALAYRLLTGLGARVDRRYV